MRWVWVAAGHWWTLGKCYSWWTQRWRGPEVSGPLSASGEEEAGCTQWWGLDCKHSLLLLMQKKVGRVRGERQRGERVVEVERKDIRAMRGGEQKRSETSNRFLWDCLSETFWQGSSFHEQMGSRHTSYTVYYITLQKCNVK